MTDTAETLQLDLDKLTFVRGHPREFARLLPEISDLRASHYLENEVFSGRTDAEVERFAAAPTVDSWLDPTQGIEVNPGQSYKDLQVVAAFDQNDDLRGYAYTGLNISSRIEQRFYRNRWLRPAAMAVGALVERPLKGLMPERFAYVWTREIVRSPKEPAELEAVLGALALSGHKRDSATKRKGAVYPVAEEAVFRDKLRKWKFHRDTPAPGASPKLISAFGPSGNRAVEERWQVDDIDVAIASMLRDASLDELPQVKDLRLAA